MIILWSFPGGVLVIQRLTNINKATGNMVKISNTADKTFTYVTKGIGISIGAAGAAKGTIDMLEAVVSGVGVCADGLSMATSFIPGPNVTTVITVPVSVGCKVFVYCYKKVKKMPWGC